MEGFDLTRYQNDDKEKEKIALIMGKMMSGRRDYAAVIEKREDIIRCKKCNWVLKGGDKFCPECGTKA